jgi:RimJ/RimL family protein N-acetyltransferase
MSVHFYLSDGRSSAEPCLAPNLQMHCWRPGVDGFPSRRWLSLSNIWWWAFDRLGVFARPSFAAVRITRHGRIVQQLIVTPAWYRFPFMAPDDLQIGAVWTPPDARRQQLAATAIGETHRIFGSRETRFWYVADSNNVASGALARACGYRLVAVGRRTRPFRISLLGRFVIERWVQRERTATEAIDPDCSDESGAGRTLSVSH